MRGAGDEFGDFEAALNVALGILDRLAMFGAEQLGQLVHVAIDQCHEIEEDAGATLRIGGRPFRLGSGGGGHCGLEIGGIGEGNAGLDIAGGGVEHVLELAALAGGLSAVDEMADGAHGASSLLCCRDAAIIHAKQRQKNRIRCAQNIAR